MERNPSWQANSHSVIQEILRLLWKSKFHYRLQNTPHHIGQYPHPVHNFTLYLNKIHSNIILPSTPRSSEKSFPSRFPTKTLYVFLISPMRATCPVYLIIVNLITWVIFSKVHKLRSSTECSLLQSPALTVP